MDGVLVDSYQAWFHLMNAAARDLGYAEMTPEGFKKAWGQGIQADVDVFFVRHTLEEVETYYNTHFREHARHVVCHPDAPGLFRELKARGVSMAVITNTPGVMAQDVLEAAGLIPDALVGGTDVENAKPAPDMVQEALRRLGASGEEAVVVGDSRFDLEAAEAAGVHCIGVGLKGGDTIEALGELLPLLERSLPVSGSTG